MVKRKSAHADESIGIEKVVTEKDLNGAAELCLLGTRNEDKNNSCPKLAIR